MNKSIHGLIVCAQRFGSARFRKSVLFRISAFFLLVIAGCSAALVLFSRTYTYFQENISFQQIDNVFFKENILLVIPYEAKHISYRAGFAGFPLHISFNSNMNIDEYENFLVENNVKIIKIEPITKEKTAVFYNPQKQLLQMKSGFCIDATIILSNQKRFIKIYNDHKQKLYYILIK